MIDRECLVEVTEIKTDLKHVLTNQEDFKNCFIDHDEKINKLTAWKNKASGIAIVVSIMIPVIIMVV